MLDQGVITESRSLWQGPLVVVPKKDGTLRLCVDFRKVNVISRFDAFSMLQISELLDRVGQAKFIFTLDLTKGYWQIPVWKEDQAKTTFRTPWGLYKFKRMPFGLHGAAATFQWLTDWVLAPHQHYATAYIDDIIVYTNNWTQHLEALWAVLRELRSTGLMANPRTCVLGKAETKYLGFVVRQGRISPLTDKMEAI